MALERSGSPRFADHVAGGNAEQVERESIREREGETGAQ